MAAKKEIAPELPADPVTPEQRMALALRIQCVVEREMDALERVLGSVAPADLIEAEQGARTLASVARTLREITAMTKSEQEAPPDETDDDSVPRDIDAFREELARRIHAFIDARQARQSGGGGAADGESGRA